MTALPDSSAAALDCGSSGSSGLPEKL